MMQKSIIENLYVDILNHIATFLSTEDIYILKFVCLKFYRFSKSKNLKEKHRGGYLPNSRICLYASSNGYYNLFLYFLDKVNKKMIDFESPSFYNYFLSQNLTNAINNGHTNIPDYIKTIESFDVKKLSVPDMYYEPVLRGHLSSLLWIQNNVGKLTSKDTISSICLIATTKDRLEIYKFYNIRPSISEIRYAIKYGSINCLNYILSLVDMNNYCYTELNFTSLEVVKKLKEIGIKFGCCDTAVNTQNTDIIDFLINNGAHLTYNSYEYARSTNMYLYLIRKNVPLCTSQAKKIINIGISRCNLELYQFALNNYSNHRINTGTNRAIKKTYKNHKNVVSFLLSINYPIPKILLFELARNDDRDNLLLVKNTWNIYKEKKTNYLTSECMKFIITSIDKNTKIKKTLDWLITNGCDYDQKLYKYMTSCKARNK